MRNHTTRSLVLVLYFVVLALIVCPGTIAQRLLVSSWGTGEVKRYDVKTKTYQANFLSGNGLQGSHAIIYGPDGNLYVASGESNEVKRYNSHTGAFIDNYVPSGSGGLNGPYGLAFGPDGHLYVSCYNTGVVKRFQGQTGAFMDDVAAGTGLTGPTELLFEQNQAHRIPLDLKGDGNTDLLWRNVQSGDTSVWYMNGGRWTGQWDYVAHGIPTVWTLSLAADLFNDGNSELVWRNSTTGDVTVWYMNGAIYTGQWDYIAQNVPLEWSLVGVADINRDSSPDLLWQNTRTGDVTVWYMSGANYTGPWDYIAHGVPTEWRIIPAF